MIKNENLWTCPRDQPSTKKKYGSWIALEALPINQQQQQNTTTFEKWAQKQHDPADLATKQIQQQPQRPYRTWDQKPTEHQNIWAAARMN